VDKEKFGESEPPVNHPQTVISDSSSVEALDSAAMKAGFTPMKGALLSTRFSTFEEFLEVVEIQYFKPIPRPDFIMPRKPAARLVHRSNGQEVSSFLSEDISEKDFMNARDSGFMYKVWLGLNSPYTIASKDDIIGVYTLGKRRFTIFGEGDVAFYDLAETMFCHISGEDMERLRDEDLGEKGYINTFNHVTGQAFMTTLFSERLADFIADIHERYSLPELITGEFSEAQRIDIENGAVDNYVDIINNEWGQELGKRLKEKYKITWETHWTPTLLSNYLNDVQDYYSWAFQIDFQPFKASDKLVKRFADKINRIRTDMSGLYRGSGM
jgi:hypothetical protein